MTIATPVVSGVIGSLVFGEHLDLDVLTVVAGLACIAVAVFGVVLLSRSRALAGPSVLAPAPTSV